eukprot:10187867-Alexandrium_andersonii.AAC.1
MAGKRRPCEKRLPGHWPALRLTATRLGRIQKLLNHKLVMPRSLQQQDTAMASSMNGERLSLQAVAAASST